AHLVPVRRLLGVHGHVQGQADARGPLHARPRPLGGVEARPGSALSMQRVSPFSGPRKVLALGAHCDDIEIGCGGTLLRVTEENPEIEVRWVTFCSNPAREAEARASAAAFLARAAKSTIVVHPFKDGYLPYLGGSVKDQFEAEKRAFA